MRWSEGLALAAILLSAAGCAASIATAPANPLPAPVVVTVCPPLANYSADDQKALAAAVRALPPTSPLVRAMVDYGVLRSAVRACHG